MGNGEDVYTPLVKLAWRGDLASRNRLAELAAGPLRTYVYRRTLDRDLADDIVQDCIVDMFKLLPNLNDAGKFWPWLCSIAANRVRGGYRKQQRHDKALSERARRLQEPHGDQSQLGRAVTQELQKLVMQSMRGLKMRHREVLALRCYERRDYRSIAEQIGCTELGARLLFHRAKKALARELARNGLGRGALVSAILVFGKLTASTEAEAATVSLTTGTLNVGAAAGLLGILTGKTAVVSLTAGSLLTAIAIVTSPGGGMLQKPRAAKPATDSEIAQTTGAMAAQSYQRWYFFPTGSVDTVMMRQMVYDRHRDISYCGWLQDSGDNYWYDGKGTVFIRNCRVWNDDLSVMKLPTDKPSLSSFLSGMAGGGRMSAEQVRPGNADLLVVAGQSTQGDWTVEQTLRDYNVTDEEYFQYNWPARVRKTDARDVMHQRGWAWFTVRGTIGGLAVRGGGRLPFTHDASLEHPAWLSLEIQDGTRLVDDGIQACVYGPDRSSIARFEGGTFFAGLGRPWTGLHSIDTVRRDAAERSLPFSSRYTTGKSAAEVVVQFPGSAIVYSIDMENDLVADISFRGNGSNASQTGRLVFTYKQETQTASDEFSDKDNAGCGPCRLTSLEGIWLWHLAEGSLVPGQR